MTKIFAMLSGIKDRERNFLVFLVFLLISSCMWFFKVIGERLEADIPVGVIVKNMPQELQLEKDAELDVVVKADGGDLVAYMLGRKQVLVIDYNDMEYSDGRLTIPTSQLVNNIASTLPGSFSFRYFKENFLALEVERQTVSLPVVLSSSFVAADGLELGKVEFVPENVTVTAPSSMLQEMSFVQFGNDSVVEIGKDTVMSYILEQKKFVKYNPTVLTARVKTEPYMSVSYSRMVEISDYFAGNSEALCILPVPVTVRCSIPGSLLGEVRDGQIKVNVVSISSSAAGKDTLRFGVDALPFFIKEDRVVIEPEYIVVDRNPRTYK